MNIKSRKMIAIAALMLILGLVNWSIFDKQKLLSEGRVVLLQLMPVDPRSLMQGDYMALNFALGQDIYAALPKDDEAHWHHDVTAGDGFVVAQIDKNNVASFQRLEDEQTLQADEIRLFYRVRNGMVKFASNAFFFEEGRAQQYQSAKYGEFRVAGNGDLLLVALRDEQYQLLGSEH